MIDPAEAITAIRRLHDIADCLFAVAAKGEKLTQREADVIGAALFHGIQTMTAGEWRTVEAAIRHINARIATT